MVAVSYGDVLASRQLSPYFEHASVSQLVQSLFMTGVMGGPSSFSGEQVRDSHRHLHIDTAAFCEMLRLLEEAEPRLRRG